MVSAMIPSKNVASGIDAVSRIPDARLVVAGDGLLRDDLRAQADRLMPGRYRQIQVSPDRMPDLYRSANVFLHLSKDESFGNVYVEAMEIVDRQNLDFNRRCARDWTWSRLLRGRRGASRCQGRRSDGYQFADHYGVRFSGRGCGLE